MFVFAHPGELFGALPFASLRGTRGSAAWPRGPLVAVRPPSDQTSKGFSGS